MLDQLFLPLMYTQDGRRYYGMAILGSSVGSGLVVLSVAEVSPFDLIVSEDARAEITY